MPRDETRSAQWHAPHAASPEATPAPAAADAASSAPALTLDLEAVADVEGLAEEIAVLRASIRELTHPHGDISERVKILAELRHQIGALCTTLKTQQALAGRDGDGRVAELMQSLEELGDDGPGVSR